MCYCDSPKKVFSGLIWPRNNFMWGVCMPAAQSTTLGNSVVFVCVCTCAKHRLKNSSYATE